MRGLSLFFSHRLVTFCLLAVYGLPAAVGPHWHMHVHAHDEIERGGRCCAVEQATHHCGTSSQPPTADLTSVNLTDERCGPRVGFPHGTVLPASDCTACTICAFYSIALILLDAIFPRATTKTWLLSAPRALPGNSLSIFEHRPRGPPA